MNEWIHYWRRKRGRGRVVFPRRSERDPVLSSHPPPPALPSLDPPQPGPDRKGREGKGRGTWWGGGDVQEEDIEWMGWMGWMNACAFPPSVPPSDEEVPSSLVRIQAAPSLPRLAPVVEWMNGARIFLLLSYNLGIDNQPTQPPPPILTSL